MQFPVTFALAPHLAIVASLLGLIALTLAGASMLAPLLWLVAVVGFVYLFPLVILIVFDQVRNDLRENAAEVARKWAEPGADPRLEWFYIACAAVTLLSSIGLAMAALHGSMACKTPGCFASMPVKLIVAALGLFVALAQYALVRRKDEAAQLLARIAVACHLAAFAMSGFPLL